MIQGYHRLSKPLLGAQMDWSHELAQNLIAQFLMNEGGGSAVYSGVDQTSLPLASGNAWTGGRDGSALSFSGTSSVMSASSTSSLDQTTNSFSVEAWFRTPTTATSQGLFGKGSAARYSLDISSANRALFTVNDGTSTNQSNPSVTICDGNWHQQVGVVDRAGGKVWCYVDGGGSSATSASVTLTATGSYTNAAAFKVGSQSSGINPLKSGQIALIRIWNRALTQPEIAWLYREPYANVLAPNARRFFAIASGGGGGGGTVHRHTLQVGGLLTDSAIHVGV